MPSIHGTQTEKNLLAAFAGESQARNRYTLFAAKARTDGYELVAQIFEETARNELAHAKRFFSFLEGYPVQITATYPAGKVGTTLQNLDAAQNGEHEEGEVLYPEFATVASNEGFTSVAAVFNLIASIEKAHRDRYKKYLELVEAGWVFTGTTTATLWICSNCGYITAGTQPPAVCPVCMEDKTYFTQL
ncbi:rubrerythrin family protein [Myxococcota bacterium]|nr:rubrerythrin family protein [Myxococcota bacterium]MBU1413843.1 rubrerythrin family protein [Myxococcota bacterium]MBU1509919.1 rubrerythrin family protein [Myxococcota bacterium]PKN25557.1 MAG: rubrerythrin family protein [Deltaproteobacteria bacterium HGW-Deltaproteobacteria-22]